jgi:hypothetical protein
MKVKRLFIFILMLSFLPMLMFNVKAESQVGSPAKVEVGV